MQGDNPEDKEKNTKVPVLTSQRWILSYIGVFVAVFVFGVRSNISIAIVCMVKPEVEVNTSLSQNSSVAEDSTCKEVFLESDYQSAEFTWSRMDQAKLLSYYYFGYMAAQIFGGSLAKTIGGKHVIGVGLLLTSLCTLLTPVLTRANFTVALVLRVILGLLGGVVCPSWYDLLGRWAPPFERSRMLSVFFIGINIGVILTYASAGFLCRYGFDNGWPSIFYIEGIFGLACLIVWQLVVSNSPDQHPRITEEERFFLERMVPSLSYAKTAIPWCHILTSVRVWAVILAHMCSTWTYYVLLICLPMFMKENGLLSSLPFVTTMISLFVSSHIADLLMRKGCLTVTATRRLFQTLGFAGVIVCVLPVGFVTCDQRLLVVLCLSLCTFFLSFGDGAGHTITLVELAPQYASVIFAISNTVASIPANVAPQLIAFLTPNGTSEEWRVVFYILAGTALLGAIIYGFAATSKVQPWAVTSTAEHCHGDIELEIPEKQNFLPAVKPVIKLED